MIAIGMTRSGRCVVQVPARARIAILNTVPRRLSRRPCRAEQVAIGIKLPELLLTLPKI